MPILSAVIGSAQTSKAVGSQVDAGNKAISTIGNATTTAQNSVNSAVGSANDTLSGVAGSEYDNLAPYLQAGQQGITSLSSMLQPGGELTKQFNFDPTDLTKDPGYQFQLQQGDQGVARAAAARGQANSGNLSTALSQYNQGLAGTTYNNAYNRALTTFQTNRQNTLQPISTLINAGQTATGQFNNALQNYGDTKSSNDIYGGTYSGNTTLSGAKSISDLLLGIGNAKAAGSVAQGNIWGGYANGATSRFNSGGGLVGAATGVM